MIAQLAEVWTVMHAFFLADNHEALDALRDSADLVSLACDYRQEGDHGGADRLLAQALERLRNAGGQDVEL